MTTEKSTDIEHAIQVLVREQHAHDARLRTRENDDELSDAVCNAVMSQGATDEEIAAVLRHPRRWSYFLRDPNGRVACWGRGKTRAECEHVAEENAAAYAFEMTGGSLQPGWRFLIWPPAALTKQEKQMAKPTVIPAELIAEVVSNGPEADAARSGPPYQNQKRGLEARGK